MAIIKTVGVNYTNSNANTFPNPNGNNTWQPWQQLTASCPIDTDEVLFFCGGQYYIGNIIYELGIGAAGSEISIAGPFIVGKGSNGSYNTPGLVRKLPIKIPAGQRIAARWQEDNNNSSGGPILMLINRSGNNSNRVGIVDSYGAVLTTSQGTPVAASSTANVKGAWVQLTASTLRDYQGIYVDFGNSSTTNATFLFDVAVGAAGSEQIIVPDIWFGGDQTMGLNQGGPYPEFPVRIPAGNRIAVRCQSTTASASIPICIIGVS